MKLHNETTIIVLSYVCVIMTSLSFLIPINLMAQKSMDNVSIKKLERMAWKGNPDACFQLGMDYYNGDRVEKDLNQAEMWFRLCSHPIAKTWQAKMNYEMERYEQAYKIALDFASDIVNGRYYPKEYANCITFLARCNLHGEGTIKNIPEAIKWLKLAVSRYSTYAGPQALDELHKCYCELGDMEKAFATACSIYKKGMGPLKLAEHYLYGMGCEQRLDSVNILLLDIAKGDKTIYQSGRHETKYTKYGQIRAQYFVGVADYFDKSRENHYEKAVRWLTMVVESEEADDKTKGEAMCVLQRCYRFGRGVPQDITKAIELERQAKTFITEDEYNTLSAKFKFAYPIQHSAQTTSEKITKNETEVMDSLVKHSVSEIKNAILFFLTTDDKNHANISNSESRQLYGEYLSKKFDYKQSLKAFMCYDKDDDTYARSPTEEKLYAIPIPTVTLVFINLSTGKTDVVKKDVRKLLKFLEKKIYNVESIEVDSAQVYLVDDVRKMEGVDIGKFTYYNEHVSSIIDYQVSKGVYEMKSKNSDNFYINRGKTYYGVTQRDEEELMSTDNAVIILGNVKFTIFYK